MKRTNWICLGSAALFLSFGLASFARQPLTFEERVKAQEAIEWVYYEHRIWPKENPGPKPSFEEMVPRAQIEAKVTDYLKKNLYLEQVDEAPITGEQLQAEIDRMSRSTHDPGILQELHAALNNDPHIIAECLARPCLVADHSMPSHPRFLLGGQDDFLGGSFIEPPNSYRLSSPAPMTSGTWTTIDDAIGPKPSARYDHAAIWTGAEMVVWGGVNGSTYLNTGGQYYPATNSWIATGTTNVPPARSQLSIVWTGTEIIVWGGYSGSHTNSGGRYNPTTPTTAWVTTSTGTNCPSGSNGNSAAWTGTRMIIWGSGMVGALYDPSSGQGSWTTMAASGQPSTSRWWHTTVWTDSKMIVWGGYPALNTGGVYTPPTPEGWTTTSTDSVPEGRGYLASVWTGSQMLIWGGSTGDVSGPAIRTGGRYSPGGSGTWSPITTTDAPAARCDYRLPAVWTGLEMLLWGGRTSGTTPTNTGGLYNPANDSWQSTPVTGDCPSARFGHTIIWTGSQAIVWGGTTGSSTLSSGASIFPEGLPSGVQPPLLQDPDPCQLGVGVSWQQDPGSWNDTGGSRSYWVLQTGNPLSSGGCSGPISYGIINCTDTTSPGGLLSYSMRYVNDAGVWTDSSSVNVYDDSTLPPTLSGPGLICFGESIALSTGAFAAYQWLRDGLDIPGAIAQNLLVTMAGTYAVRATDSFGCTVTSSGKVVVLAPLPTPTIIGSATGCVSPGVDLSTQAFSSYQWLKDGVSIVGATSQFLTVTASGDYSVRVADANGCIGESADWTVLVYPIPTPTVTGPSGGCENPGIGLSTQAFSGYQWKVRPGVDGYSLRVSGTVGSNIGNSYFYNILASPDFTLQAGDMLEYDLYITSGSPTAQSALDLVASGWTLRGSGAVDQNGISAHPSANLASRAQGKWYHRTIAIPASGIGKNLTGTSRGIFLALEGDGVGSYATYATNIRITNNGVLRLLVFGGGASFTYPADAGYSIGTGYSGIQEAISNDSFNISGAMAQIVTANMTGLYFVEVTDTNGCVGMSPGHGVTVNSTPGPTITGSAGGCVTPGVSLFTQTWTTSQWYKNDLIIPGATNPNYTATTSGTYTVQVTDVNGCLGTSAGKVVVVNPLPIPTVTGRTIGCANPGEVLSTQPFSSYQWRKDGVDIPSATTQFYTATASGAYSVRVADANGCVATSPGFSTTLTPSPVPTISVASAACTSMTLLADSWSAYQWYKDGALIAGSIGQSHVATTTGTYSVLVTDSNGCSGVSAGKAVTLNVNPAPVINSSIFIPGTSLLFPLDESPATNGIAILDQSGSGNHGVLYTGDGSNKSVVGRLGNGIQFDGTDDYIEVPNSTLIDLRRSLSIAFWMKREVSGGWRSIVYKGTGAILGRTYIVWLNDSGQLYAVTCDATGEQGLLADTPIPVGVWTHYVCTIDRVAGSIQAYINGALVKSGSVRTTDAVSTTNPLRVGWTQQSGVAPYMGTLDEVALFQRALTPSEVSSIYLNGLGSASGTITLCQGASASLSTASYTEYQWAKDGVDIPGATGQAYSATEAGSYTVRVVDINGCQGVSTGMPVVVTPLPAPTVTGATTGCVTPGITLSTQSFSIYQWKKDGVDISGATAQNFTATASGSYSVRVAGANGCTGTSPGHAVTLSTNPAPTVSGATTGCANPGVVLSTELWSTYQWRRNGAALAGATSQNYTAATSGTYTVVVTDSNGCSGTSSGKIVTINANPAPTVTGPSVICTGNSISLSTGTYATYQWQIGGADIPGAATQSYLTSAAGTYTVRVTDSNGCTGTSAGKVVTVSPLPSPSVTGSATGCVSPGVALSTQGYASYQWYLDALIIVGATSQNFAATTNGSYSVRVTDTNGCVGTSPGHIVTVITNPVPTITGAATGCSSPGVALSTEPWVAYQWRRNGAILTGATTQNYTATTSGTYTVVVTDNNGCSGTSAGKIVTISVSPAPMINNGAISGAVLIFPMDEFPATDGRALVDQSGSGNNGVLWTGDGSDKSVAGRFGRGIQFDGIDDNITVQNSSSIDLTRNLSISFWMKSMAAPSWKAIIQKGPIGGPTRTYNVSIDGTNIYLETSDGTLQYWGVSIASIPTGQWFHYIGILDRDAGVAKIYVDGVLKNTGTLRTTDAVSSTTPLRVATPVEGTYSVDAALDELAIFPRVLTPSEISLLYTGLGTVSGPINLCQGESTILNTSDYTAYQWAKDGVDILGETAKTYTTDQAGVYTVRVTDSTGCAGTSPGRTVTVNPLPTPIISGMVTGCVIPGVVLTTQTFTTYKWYRDGAAIAGATSQSYSANRSGNYSVEVTDSYGCKGLSAPHPLAIGPEIIGSATGCTTPGVPLQLSSGTYSAYQWYRDGISIAGATSNTYNATQSGVYTLQVSGGSGCQGTTLGKTVTIYSNPSPTISGPVPPCSSGTLSTQAFSTYQWYRNGSLVSGANAQTYTAAVPGTYKVWVLNNSGCGAFSADFVINANPAPVVSGPNTGCSSVILTTTAFSTYQWIKDGVNIPGATSQTYTALANGTYSVRVTNSAGCAATSAGQAVTLQGMPVPTISGPQVNTCPATKVTLIASAGFASYRWNYNGVLISGATNQTYDALLSGNYTVTVTEGTGCEGNSTNYPVLIDFCATSEVSPQGAVYPARLTRDSNSATGYYLYFQKLDSLMGYNVYEGTLGTPYSHASQPGNRCNVVTVDQGTGQMRAEVIPSTGNRYYLVTAYNGSSEGPSGYDSAGNQIPAAQSTCGP